MTITIKYLGLIADITQKKEEVYTSISALLTVENLVKNLLQQYNNLSKTSFIVAVNTSIATNDLALNNNDTIALLPPFAGG
ncbi:MoaD/ThiS family protein [Pedobacter alpinus]|uniref:MoaD/ThiS family protein n=1 Tax=Pedobacter alpinus TaxID=1590643 RepID=A0ABW5TWH4_9SPHI